MIKLLALLFGLAVSASASPYDGVSISTATGTATRNLSGTLNIAASSATANTPTIILNGSTGSITLGSWLASIIGSAFGGTGANLSAALQGAIPFFHSTGVMSSLAPGTSGFLLKSQGASADIIWTNPASITAGLATAIAGGSANQLIYQSAAGTTAFLGPLTNGQLAIGSTGNPPVATTLTAGSGISIVNGPGTITVNAVANGTPQPPWEGFNYANSLSSAPLVADSTATFSYNIEAFNAIFRGNSYSVNKQNLTVVASTYTVTTWNPTNGFRQWGINNFSGAALSSGITNGYADDLVVAISSTDAAGRVYLFDTINRLPFPTMAHSGSVSTNYNAITAGTVGSFYDCVASGPLSFESCDANAVDYVPWNGSSWGPMIHFVQTRPQKYCFVVNNTSGGSANVQLYDDTGIASSLWISINGANGSTTPSNVHTPTNYSVNTGYSSVCFYFQPTSGQSYEWLLKLPANVAFVRPGEW